MSLFRCKVCEEKDKRISDLKLQLEDMSRLVLPPKRSPGYVSPVLIESDAILSGAQDPITLSPEQQEEFDALQLEADQILAGNY